VPTGRPRSGFKGDLRVRNENIAQERVVQVDKTAATVEDAADRNRTRFRRDSVSMQP
jgi:hypothetical protein